MRFIILALLFGITLNVYADSDGWYCVGESIIMCKKEVDGQCLEYFDEPQCTEATRTTTRYSSGCDLSNILAMINQEHCDVEVTCNDEIVTEGTCQRGAGCYPGTYVDTCPAGYDIRSTGNIEDVTCSTYGQNGTLSLQEFEYGYFTGEGAALTLRGGEVSCQKYYGPRENTNCAAILAEGGRPSSCYVNECADLANNPRCVRTEDVTEFGDEATIMNTDCVWITNPGTGGTICTDDPNEIAEITDDRRLYDVQIEQYQCEAADVRNCQDREYNMICPDGSTTLCQSQNTCIREITENFTETTTDTIVANRNYESFDCIVENGSCVQYQDNSECLLMQSDASPPIEIVSGTGSISTGENNVVLTLGEVGNNYWTGWCDVYERSYTINILDIDRIGAAILQTAKWDDFIQIYINDQLIYRGEGSAVEGRFPPETDSCWDPSESRTINPNFDIKPLLHDGLNTFKIRVSVADEGEGYAFFDLEINTQNTYYCYSDYNFEHVSNNCTPSTSESLCTYWLTGPYDDTRGVCTRSAFYMNCVEESSRNVCQDWNEEIICNDQAVNLPNVTLENDIMDGFAESLGILGLLDDINSIWSGEYGKCSYGYFVDGFGGLYCNNCTGQGGFLCFETKPEQQKAYEMNKKGLCHYISTSCTNRIDMGFGSVCLENTRKYCCYDSKLARVIVEQSYSQLGKSWNSGCNGLTLDELNELDFGAMDFSEIEEDLENKINIDATYYSESMKDKIGDFYSDFTEEMDDRGVIDDPEN